MNPLLFPAYLWERLTWWSVWLNSDGTGRADVIGAATTGFVVALAAAAFIKRDSLKPTFSWIRAHPLWTVVLAAPVATLALVCLSKFATFIGATLTTVGLLIALDNNRKSHDREAKRFIRQGHAARAVLSLELSAISEYCVAYATALKSIRLEPPPPYLDDIEVPPVIFPAVPSTAAATFKEVILSTDNEKLTEQIADLLSYTQHVKAYTSLVMEKKMGGRQNTIDHAKLRVALLYSLSASLFDYARRESEDIMGLNWHVVSNSIMSLGLDHDHSFTEYYVRTKEAFDDPLEVLPFNRMRTKTK